MRGPGERVAEEQLSQSWRCGLPWQREAGSLLHSPAVLFSQPSASFAESDEPQRKEFPFEMSSAVQELEIMSKADVKLQKNFRISPPNFDVKVKKSPVNGQRCGLPSVLARIFELLTPPLQSWSFGWLFCTKISSPPGCVEGSQELPRRFSCPAASPE